MGWAGYLACMEKFIQNVGRKSMREETIMETYAQMTTMLK
jgi:hypothetical protein